MKINVYWNVLHINDKRVNEVELLVFNRVFYLYFPVIFKKRK